MVRIFFIAVASVVRGDQSTRYVDEMGVNIQAYPSLPLALVGWTVTLTFELLSCPVLFRSPGFVANASVGLPLQRFIRLPSQAQGDHKPGPAVDGRQSTSVLELVDAGGYLVGSALCRTAGDGSGVDLGCCSGCRVWLACPMCMRIHAYSTTAAPGTCSSARAGWFVLHR